MDDIVICEPLRTPVGRFGGALASLSAADLAALTLTELVRRTGLQEGDVDDVVLGHCYPSGEAPALGRVAALDAGLGTGVPGVQVDRRCGSGLQAVLYAAGQVATGAASVVVAGGAESMSNVEHYALGLRTGVRGGGVELMDRLVRARETAGGRHHPVPGGMLETAENLREQYAVPREDQDLLALRSQQRAAAAHDEGRFADELVPVTVPGRRGKPDTVVDRDEHPRAGTTLDDLAALRPVRLEDRSRVHRDRRQRQRPERRRRDVRRDDAGRGASAAGCGRCWRCGPGPSPGSPRRRWASGRSPRPPRRWPAPA